MPARSTVPTGRASALLDEVLAQLGQHLLAERLDERSARSGSAPSAATQERRRCSHDRSGRRGRWWCRSATACDEVAEQPRRGQRRRARPARAGASATSSMPRVPAAPARARSARTAAAVGDRQAVVLMRLLDSALALAGDDARGSAGSCRAARGGCPSATTRPSREEGDVVDPVEHQRAGRGDHGGPAGAVRRAAGRRSGPRCGRRPPGRLDQHQDLRVGGRARASTSRCRWPPENVAAALGDHGVEAVGQRLEDVLGRRGAQGAASRRRPRPRDVELVAEPAGEQRGAGVGRPRSARRTSARRRSRQRDAAAA